MRKIKTIKIDELEITVKELRVKDVRKILSGVSDINDIHQAMELLPMVTDLPAATMEDMSPSELKQVWEAVKEVNAFFLSLLEKSGLTTALKSSIQNSLTESFATSFKSDTPGA